MAVYMNFIQTKVTKFENENSGTIQIIFNLLSWQVYQLHLIFASFLRLSMLQWTVVQLLTCRIETPECFFVCFCFEHSLLFSFQVVF